MKALVCENYGPIDSLKIKEYVIPSVGSGQVKIDVSFASVNFPDALIVQGLYQVKPPTPFVPGHELSGVVSEIGNDVRNVQVGQRVVATPGVGGFAEHVVVDESKVIALPNSMTMEQGASLTLTYGTSLNALQNCAELKNGETLLILGASGGVGAAAIEIGKIMGAKVIAAASSQDKLNFCKNLGADECINYDSDDLKKRVAEITNGKGVDVVYDAVGGSYSETALRSLGWRGRYLVVGFAAGSIPKIPLNLVLLSERKISGVFWGEWVRRNPQDHLKNMQLLESWFTQGLIRPLVTISYPLDQAKEAINHLASRKAMGKVIIEINAKIV